jgi:hypothetical protein
MGHQIGALFCFQEKSTYGFTGSFSDALQGLLLPLTRQVLFLIPLILILPLWSGIFGVLHARRIADFIAFSLSLILVHREFK